MIYLRLFYHFFKTGLFAVGGGLATLPFLYEISSNTGWFSHADIADMIAVSESTPGAIGLNMSTYAGYKTAGVAGAACASLGLALPSLIIILIIAKFLARFRDNVYVNKVFYGLRPASIAMITAAGIGVAKITFLNHEALAHHASGSFILWKAVVLAVLLFLAQKKLKWHPVLLIAISAVVGIVLKF